jgi:hypothetical protein
MDMGMKIRRRGMEVGIEIGSVIHTVNMHSKDANGSGNQNISIDRFEGGEWKFEGFNLWQSRLSRFW